MVTARHAKWTPAAERSNSSALAGDVADLVRAFKALIDPYRPELHYMRGPGPKWHAKHDQVRVATGFRAMLSCKAR